jgi:excisionase family DNA binding protein
MNATITIPEAAELLGVSRNLAYQLAARDGAIAGIPVIRVGRRLLLPTAPLWAALGINQHEERGTKSTTRTHSGGAACDSATQTTPNYLPEPHPQSPDGKPELTSLADQRKSPDRG